MLTIPAKLTPRQVKEIDVLIKEGWYSSRSEALRDAVRAVIEKHRRQLLEQAIKEDIKWGLNAK